MFRKTKFLLTAISYKPILLAVLLVQSLFSQDLVYKNYKTENGLPSNTVYSLFSDFDGFLYIATDNGIVKFDGSQFKQLTQHPSLTSTAHTWLSRKAPHLPLIGYSFGETFIEIRNDSVVPIFQEYLKKVPIPNELHYYMTENGDLYYTGEEKLYKINLFPRLKLSSHLYKNEKNIPFNPIVINDSLVIAISNIEELVILNPMDQLNNIKYIINPSTFKKNTGNRYQQKLFEHDGEIYFVANILEKMQVFVFVKEMTGFILHENLSLIFSKIQSNIIRIKSLNNALWITSQKGVHRIYKDEIDYNIESFFIDKTITDIENDRENNYWLSILNEGVSFLPNFNTLTYNNFYGKSNSTIYSKIKLTNSKILLGNIRGEVFEYHNKTISPIFNKNLVEDFIYSNNNNYLISAGGLFAINNHNEIILDNASIKSISPISPNYYLVGTHATSYILNFDFDSIFKIDTIRSQRTNATLFDSHRNEFWVGYSDHLMVHKKKNNFWVSTIITDSNENRILARTITQSSDSSIWIGTKTDGIHRIKHQEWIEKRINKRNETLAIKELVVKDSLIIAATNNGLWITSINGTFESRFTSSKGLIDKEINSLTISDNTLLVATSNGLQQIPFNELIKPSSVPKTYIKSVLIKDSLLEKHRDITINYNEFPLEINFGAISFRHSDRVIFSYRLSGLSNDWEITPINSPFVRYFSLPPGSYTFQLFSINGDDKPDDTIQEVIINVLPPYWKTSWFWFVVIISTASLLFYTIRIREKRILSYQKIVTEKEFLTQELRISQLSTIKAQMNPHFIFNALNSIQNFIFKNDRLSANMYLGKFADLIRLILNHSTEFEISLSEEIKALNLYLELEAIRFKDQLSYSISTNGIPDLNEVFIPSMLIQPFVENAIKHGILHKKNPGKVSIHFSLKNSTLEIIIEDDGIGRKRALEIQAKKNKPHKSFSMLAIQQRLQLINMGNEKPIEFELSDLTETSNGDCGTRVRIHIPINEIK